MIGLVIPIPHIEVITDLSVLSYYGPSLQSLSDRARSAFATFCAERVVGFWDRVDDSSILRDVLKVAWALAEGGDIASSAVDRLSESLLEVIPDSAGEPDRLSQHFA